MLALLLAAVLATEAPHEGQFYRLVVEVMDTDGSMIEKAYHDFPTLAAAFAEVKKLHRSGVCFVLQDPPIPDPQLAGLCYPPSKIVRTRVLLY